VNSPVPVVTVDQLPTDALILDVREDDEWAAGHVEGALHVPMNLVPNRVSYEPEMFGDKTVYVMCKMGGRSSQVAAWLNHNGHTAVNIAGGMHAWADSGRAMSSSTGEAPFVL
jgi:rhodanese-related sulfurtransferase